MSFITSIELWAQPCSWHTSDKRVHKTKYYLTLIPKAIKENHNYGLKFQQQLFLLMETFYQRSNSGFLTLFDDADLSSKWGFFDKDNLLFMLWNSQIANVLIVFFGL